MNITSHSFRHAEVILNEPDLFEQYQEVLNIIEGISDEDIITQLNTHRGDDGIGGPKSISVPINELLKDRFQIAGWNSESAIFQDAEYQNNRWRLDFAKQDISIEVAFNHGEAIAWNLIKPVLATELNHVIKAIQTRIGIIITATEGMRNAGGFDSAVGTYEKFLRYLPPLQNILTVPVLIIGLLPPESFRILHSVHNGRNYAVVESL